MVYQSDAPLARLITAIGSKHNIKLIVSKSHAPECEVVIVLVVVLVFVVLVVVGLLVLGRVVVLVFVVVFAVVFGCGFGGVCSCGSSYGFGCRGG